MKFQHFAESETNIKRFKTKTKQNKTAKQLIEDQVDYLYGAMGNDNINGVPRGDHKIKVSNIETLPNGKTRVNYDYEGTVLLRTGARKYTTFYMPRDPSEKGSYDPAINIKKDIVTSTDEHYQGFDDYWYFWDPAKKGSLLKEGEHYDEVKASFERKANTARTYPEYENLLDKSSGTIPISIFFGMDDADNSRNAIRGKDAGAFGYRGLRSGLHTMGFKKVEHDKSALRDALHLKRIPPSRFTYEEFEKDTPKGKMIVKMFFGPTDIDEYSRSFHHLYKNALENSSLVIYDGHSGLGENLDLKQIEKDEKFKVKKHPSKYQIYFFNSCTSYSYYVDPYFRMKHKSGGHKALDLLSNGLATYFDEDQNANQTLIKAVDNWAMTGKKESYQSLAKKMEQLGRYDIPNLFNVKGDEDNR